MADGWSGGWRLTWWLRASSLAIRRRVSLSGPRRRVKKSELSSLAESSRTDVGGPHAPPFSSIRKRPEGPYQDLLGFLGDGYGLTGPTPLSQWPHLSAPARGGSGGAGRCSLPAWKAPGSGRRRRLASCSRPEPVAAGESPGLGACALRCSGDHPACGFLRQCPVSGSSGQRPQPAVWHLPGGPRDVFSVGLPRQFADEAHHCAIPRSAGEIPCPLPQSLASSSVAVRPACAVRRRKSASSWSSASPYSAQIWSIEVFIPE